VSEDAYKQRLRAWKQRTVTTYTRQGYTVLTYDSGPFHISLCKGRAETRVRFAFTYATLADADAVKKAHTPDRCSREVWQISDDGRTVIVYRIPKT
jgi:hypothetical protein